LGKKLNMIVWNVYEGKKTCHADVAQKRQRKKLRKK
jgi:hypothetical protein